MNKKHIIQKGNKKLKVKKKKKENNVLFLVINYI